MIVKIQSITILQEEFGPNKILKFRNNILENILKILILGDEVYEYITFSQPHISFNTRPKLVEREPFFASSLKNRCMLPKKVGYLIVLNIKCLK